MSDNVRIVLVVVAIAAALAAAQLGHYRSAVDQAPIEACRALDDEQLAVDCIVGVGG